MRKRLWIVFVLLVLILLAISALSGLLNYWLGGEVAPSSTPSSGGMPGQQGESARMAPRPVHAFAACPRGFQAGRQAKT